MYALSSGCANLVCVENSANLIREQAEPQQILLDDLLGEAQLEGHQDLGDLSL